LEIARFGTLSSDKGSRPFGNELKATEIATGSPEDPDSEELGAAESGGFDAEAALLGDEEDEEAGAELPHATKESDNTRSKTIAIIFFINIPPKLYVIENLRNYSADAKFLLSLELLVSRFTCPLNTHFCVCFQFSSYALEMMSAMSSSDTGIGDVEAPYSSISFSSCLTTPFGTTSRIDFYVNP
jgi:hypothetical protein